MREAGLNGRAGSPPLSAPQVGFLGENSIIGSGPPIADGSPNAQAAAPGSGPSSVPLARSSTQRMRRQAN